MAIEGTAVDEVVVEWQGRPVAATRPAAIAGLDLHLGPALVRRVERAAAAVRVVGAHASGTAEVVARLLLRSEGLASSEIEGLRSTAAAVALAGAGADGGGGGGGVAAWVADNLAVVSAALDDPGPLSVEQLWRWHRRLMRHAPDLAEEHRGAWRDRLGWVGGPNPMVAAHVAAPPELIDLAMRDLLAFAMRTDVDAVTQAAVVHAQFETIHPLADGNGRIGRILIGRILGQRLGVAVPPPVSQAFARDIGGYLAGLTLYRQGQPEPWISWFAGAVDQAAGRSGATLASIAELTDAWTRQVAPLRADAGARRLIEWLPSHPALSAESAGSLLGTSRQAATAALEALADLGIVVETDRVVRGRGRPRRWWVAADLLALLGS